MPSPFLYTRNSRLSSISRSGAIGNAAAAAVGASMKMGDELAPLLESTSMTTSLAARSTSLATDEAARAPPRGRARGATKAAAAWQTAKTVTARTIVEKRDKLSWHVERKFGTFRRFEGQK